MGNKGKNRTLCKYGEGENTFKLCVCLHVGREENCQSDQTIPFYLVHTPATSLHPPVVLRGHTHTHTAVTLTRSVHKLPLLVTSRTVLQRNDPSHSAPHSPHPAQGGGTN